MAFDGAPKGFEDVVAALEAPNKPPGDDDGAGVADPNKPPPVVPGVAAPNKPPAGLAAGAAPTTPPLVVAGVAAVHARSDAAEAGAPKHSTPEWARAVADSADGDADAAAAAAAAARQAEPSAPRRGS